MKITCLPGRFISAVLLLLLFWVAGSLGAAAPALADADQSAALIGKAPLDRTFPGADKLGVPEGKPLAAAAFKGGAQVGYVFLNSDVVNAAGYSGRPISIAIGMDMTGKIVGAQLVDHHEPIVLIGIPVAKIQAYIDAFIGTNPVTLLSSGQKGASPDIVSGATVTVMVIGDTINRAAYLVAKSRKLGLFAGAAAVEVEVPKRRIDATKSTVETWQTLLGDGSIRHLDLKVADTNRVFKEGGDPRAINLPEPGPDGDTYIDLYATVVSVPTIGRSLLGDKRYKDLMARLPAGRSALMFLGNGRYSFRGTGFVRGAIFDRIQVVQEQNTLRFRDRDYDRIGDLTPADAPQFTEIGIFMTPADIEFDPAAPWRLDLLLGRAVGPIDKVFATVEVPYALPETYLLPLPPKPAAPAAAGTMDEDPAMAKNTPVWVKLWQDKFADEAVLGVALLVLTAIFFFQDWLVTRPKLLYWVRTGFLAFTLVWIGWYAKAQLSVVNVLTIFNSLASGFHWDNFLVDPLVFILWCAVAASLLFWARGAYCGWLCPFGALQEFLSRAAKFLKIPQLSLPWGVHERLWPVKYIIFLGLFGYSFYSLGDAERMAEVEPFKTAIVLHFMRDWQYVVYAALLLGAGLFVERFYCRYLCPLGGALAIPARIRMFDWLKGYRECGSPCQRCSNECPVQSIHPDGRINPNECISCLHCQELYTDDIRCPVMVQRRLKRERREALSTSSPAKPSQTHPSHPTGRPTEPSAVT